MATYLLVNILFLAVVLAVFRIVFRVHWRRPSKAWLLTLTSLILLTAVFDSFIVGFGMVAYNPAMTLGINIGAAPIEDFFYALLAAILIPLLWKILEKKYDRNN